MVANANPESWQLEPDAVIGRLRQLGGWFDGETKWGDEGVKKLTDAVKHYQEFHGLEPDGVVGRITARHLLNGPTDAIRFCGVPEFIAGDPRVQRLRESMAHDLTWHLSAPFAGMTLSESQDACKWMWDVWESRCGIRPRYVSNGRTAIALHNVGRIDGPGQVLAQSMLSHINMREGTQLDQLYDLEHWAWMPNGGRPPNGRINLAPVLLHEVGHLLGSPHDRSGTLMQPMYDWRIHLPTVADVENMQARYGPPLESNPTPKPPSDPTGEWQELVAYNKTGPKHWRVFGVEL